MVWAALILWCVFLWACGGGASSPAKPEGPVPGRTTPAMFCYYGMNFTAALETVDHANCVEAADFYGPLEQLATFTQAAGRPVVLYVPACYGLPVDRVQSEVAFWLQRLAGAGLLRNVVAVRPCDEPDLKGMSDDEVKARITAVHAAMAMYDETRAKPIAIFYACSSGARPGIDFVDWPGCDSYGDGCKVLDEYYPALEQLVNREPDRRLVAIAGGSDPWRQDPGCFVQKVRQDGRYVALLGFAYQTVTDGQTYVGIRENGMAPAYRLAGRAVTAP